MTQREETIPMTQDAATRSPSLEAVRDELLAYLNKRHACDVTADTPLLQVGIIDSLSMMKLVLHLERRYQLDFSYTRISRDNFESVSILADFIVRNGSPC